MAFASNRRAYGICDITGFRYRLKDMKKTWDGLLVGPAPGVKRSETRSVL
jgi:hypothetical protein